MRLGPKGACQISLWIRAITETENGEHRPYQIVCRQLFAKKLLPEKSRVGRKLTLTCCRDTTETQFIIRHGFLEFVSASEENLGTRGRTTSISLNAQVRTLKRRRAKIRPSSAAPSCAFPVSEPYRTRADLDSIFELNRSRKEINVGNTPPAFLNLFCDVGVYEERVRYCHAGGPFLPCLLQNSRIEAAINQVSCSLA